MQRELTSPAGAPGAESAPPELQPAEEAGPSPDAKDDEHETAGTARHHATIKWFWLGVFLWLLVPVLGAYAERDVLAPKIADESRRVIGDTNTARLEGYWFALQDHLDTLRYRVVGGESSPFRNVVRVEAVPRAPAPVISYWATGGQAADVPSTDGRSTPGLKLPTITALAPKPLPGEGVWSTAGLPHNTPSDTIMAETFVRPDPSRPYATVAALLIDMSRVSLHMTAGTGDPGGYLGNRGPGTIPAAALPYLLVAWNGGFKGVHGNFGMFADGKQYVPMENGLATLCVYGDGTIKMGEWGADLAWRNDIVACRQNGGLLLQDGAISNSTANVRSWGPVSGISADFITWRSAVGVTKDGNLIYAAGNSVSPSSLAKALLAEGAYRAMQLDINSPHVLLGEFFQRTDGSLRAEKFMNDMADSPNRFLGTQERDFMWVTFKPF